MTVDEVPGFGIFQWVDLIYFLEDGCVVCWEEVGHEFITIGFALLFKWRLKRLKGLRRLKRLKRLILVEGVEVEDPESAKHESGGLRLKII